MVHIIYQLFKGDWRLETGYWVLGMDTKLKNDGGCCYPPPILKNFFLVPSPQSPILSPQPPSHLLHILTDGVKTFRKPRTFIVVSASQIRSI